MAGRADRGRLAGSGTAAGAAVDSGKGGRASLSGRTAVSASRRRGSAAAGGDFRIGRVGVADADLIYIGSISISA